jgi:hypothetical protein
MVVFTVQEIQNLIPETLSLRLSPAERPGGELINE